MVQSGADSGAGSSDGDAGQLAAVGVSKLSEGLLSDVGLTVISYGGYLNGESFQQDGIVSYQGYQYAAFWNSSHHAVLGRRALPGGTWNALEFADYETSADAAQNSISIGICPGDGTIHLAFDDHVSTLFYRSSIAKLATNPASASWDVKSFSALASGLADTGATQLRYPRFVTEPGGSGLLFEASVGGNSGADQYLWEYTSARQSWAALGQFIYGTGDEINAYLHGLAYTPSGTRLHAAWSWRDSADASSNHDLLYMFSDDNGRTWQSDAGTAVATTGSSPVSMSSEGIKVWTIRPNRGLMNQEHMAVDTTGRVQVLLSHMPDALADETDFDDARSKSQFFVYLRDTDGAWSRNAIGLTAIASTRAKLAISSSGNAYAVLPDLRIAAASAASGLRDWTLLDTADSGRFFSDPLVDTARLLSEDTLSIFYPQRDSGNISVLDYSLR